MKRNIIGEIIVLSHKKLTAKKYFTTAWTYFWKMLTLTDWVTYCLQAVSSCEFNVNNFLLYFQYTTGLIRLLDFDCSLLHPLHEFPRFQLARRLELVKGSGGVRHNEVTQLREGARPDEINSGRGYFAIKTEECISIVAVLKTLVELKRFVKKKVKGLDAVCQNA